jgi:hypothetical protein
MNSSYYIVQVYFQDKWVDLVGGKFLYDKDEMPGLMALQLANAVEAYNLARKRAPNYAHRIIQVNVVRFNNGKD